MANVLENEYRENWDDDCEFDATVAIKYDISNRVMENFTIKIIVTKTNIFYVVLRLPYFPEKWKYAGVIML